jgi:toxin ParE1/3/4
VRLEISPKARADVAEILEYSITEFGEHVGLSYVEGLGQSFLLLTENPKIGPSVPDDTKGRRMLKHRSHFIYYRVDGQRIRILRILHKARDARRLLN